MEIDKTLQTALKRAIADEYAAGQLYMLWTLATPAGQKNIVAELFKYIADDEIKDHMMSLIEWCGEMKCDIPCTESELKRFSSAYSRKLADQMKKGKDALYYLKQAEKSEQEAILQYRKILEIDQVSEFTDLQSILWNIYYDEEEHLRKIKTAIIACQAEADLLM